ncbi:MAG: hypothetical protein AAF533_04490 [Acidobacteriota bacterium]
MFVRHVLAASLALFATPCLTMAQALSGSTVLGGGSGSPRLVHQDGELLTLLLEAQSDTWWVDVTLDGLIASEGLVGGPSGDHPTGALVTSDGGLLITTNSGARSPSISLVAVSKLDAERRHLWTRAYRPEENLVGAAELGNGDLLLVGSGDLNWMDSRIWLLRLDDDDGSVVSSTIVSGDGNYAAVDVVSHPDGGVLVAAQVAAEGTLGRELWLLRFDAALELEWQALYGGPGPERVHHVAPRVEGGWLVVGITTSYGPNPATFGSIWALAIDENGDVEWQRAFGSGLGDLQPTAGQLVDGGFLVACWSVSFGVPDLWLVALESDGSMRWQARLDAGDSETEPRVHVLQDGRVLIGAQTNAYSPTHDAEPWLVWLDPSGSFATGCPMLEPTTADLVVTDAVRGEVPFPVSEVLAVPHELPVTTTTNWTSDFRAQCWSTPPREVSAPGVVTPLRVETGGLLSWEDAIESGAETFRLYRGRLRLLPTSSSATCIRSGLDVPAAGDPDNPGAGDGWYYLVAGENVAGTGPLGRDSQGDARAPFATCP